MVPDRGRNRRSIRSSTSVGSSYPPVGCVGVMTVVPPDSPWVGGALLAAWFPLEESVGQDGRNGHPGEGGCDEQRHVGSGSATCPRLGEQLGGCPTREKALEQCELGSAGYRHPVDDCDDAEADGQG